MMAKHFSVIGLPGMRAGAFAGIGGFGDDHTLVQGNRYYRVCANEFEPRHVTVQSVDGGCVVGSTTLTTKGVTAKQVRSIKASLMELNKVRVVFYCP
jgi:hypothetical protein